MNQLLDVWNSSWLSLHLDKTILIGLIVALTLILIICSCYFECKIMKRDKRKYLNLCQLIKKQLPILMLLLKDHCFWTADYSGHSAYRGQALAILLL
jgi:hypothetical protein